MFAVYLALIFIVAVNVSLSLRRYRRLSLFERTGSIVQARIVSYGQVRKDEYYKSMGMTARDSHRLIYVFTLSYYVDGIEHTVMHRDSVLSKGKQKALADEGSADIFVSADNPEDVELKAAVEKKNRHIINIVLAAAAAALFIALTVFAGRY